jgi:predicted acetyltransferase
MTFEIRTVTEDRFADAIATTEYAFGGVPTDEDVEFERTLNEADRFFAAFDGDVIAGTTAAFTMPMTIPGGETSVGFVTGVGVRPTHRRRGITTALMRRQLEDARERGETIEILYASEGGIYGRFGYGLATFGLGMDVETSRTAFVRGYAPTGSVRFVEREEAVPKILEVNDAVRRRVPGMVGLDRARLDYTLREHGPDKDLPLLYTMHDTGGGTDGYALYRIRHDWRDSIPRSTLVLRDLQGASPGAVADLWRFVFDTDLIERVEVWSRPLDDAVLHLVQEPRRLHPKIRDGLWLRIVDVERALVQRRYAAAGRIVVQIDDAFCPWNEGRYVLEADDAGVATCARGDEEPDLRCSVTELGSAYLGGIGFRRLARAGLIDERRAGSMVVADAMFAWDPAPWCPYIF